MTRLFNQVSVLALLVPLTIASTCLAWDLYGAKDFDPDEHPMSELARRKRSASDNGELNEAPNSNAISKSASTNGKQSSADYNDIDDIDDDYYADVA